MINNCLMYLQLISFFDLLIYKTTDIHCSYIDGDVPPLMVMSHHCAVIHLMASISETTNQVLDFVESLHQTASQAIDIKITVSLGFSVSSLLASHLSSLIPTDEGSMFKYILKRGAASRFQVMYHNIPYICDTEYYIEVFYPVDVHSSSQGMHIIGDKYPEKDDDSQTPL